MTRSENRSAFDWDTRFRDGDTPWERGELHPAAQSWLDSKALSAGCSVIIPGCGRSPELLAFARAGLRVTGADLSRTAIEWQRQELKTNRLSASLVTDDVLGGDETGWQPEAPVDLVYEQTFLCAIHPRLRETYESRLTHWLKPGGKFLALFMQKDESGGPPYGCAPEAMRTLFPESRWIWPDPVKFEAWPHPQLNGKSELGTILIRRQDGTD